jgi:hypothetical protein
MSATEFADRPAWHKSRTWQTLSEVQEAIAKAEI